MTSRKARNQMAKGRKSKSKKSKGSKAKKPKSKHIPLKILEKRLGKLNSVVKSRGGSSY